MPVPADESEPEAGRQLRQQQPPGNASTKPIVEHAHVGLSDNKLYTSRVAAPPGVLFELFADMPNYGRFAAAPSSRETADVEAYPSGWVAAIATGNPMQTRERTGGQLVGFQQPGALDFAAHRGDPAAGRGGRAPPNSFEPEGASAR